MMSCLDRGGHARKRVCVGGRAGRHAHPQLGEQLFAAGEGGHLVTDKFRVQLSFLLSGRAGSEPRLLLSLEARELLRCAPFLDFFGIMVLLRPGAPRFRVDKGGRERRGGRRGGKAASGRGWRGGRALGRTARAAHARTQSAYTLRFAQIRCSAQCRGKYGSIS